jgi:hypothetical protein
MSTKKHKLRSHVMLTHPRNQSIRRLRQPKADDVDVNKMSLADLKKTFTEEYKGARVITESPYRPGMCEAELCMKHKDLGVNLVITALEPNVDLEREHFTFGQGIQLKLSPLNMVTLIATTFWGNWHENQVPPSRRAKVVVIDIGILKSGHRQAVKEYGIQSTTLCFYIKRSETLPLKAELLIPVITRMLVMKKKIGHFTTVHFLIL